MSGGVNKITNSEMTQLSQQSSAIRNTQRSAAVDVKNYIRREEAKKSSSATRMPSPNELKRIIDKINENVSRLNKEVRFVYSDALKSLVVKVIDMKTGKVIREIPPQEVVNLQKKLSEVVGIIFDSKEVER